MALKIDTLPKRYTPKAEGNETADDPVVLDISPLSGAEQRKLAFAYDSYKDDKEKLLGFMSDLVLTHTCNYGGVYINGQPHADAETFVRWASPSWILDIGDAVVRHSVLGAEAEKK